MSNQVVVREREENVHEVTVNLLMYDREGAPLILSDTLRFSLSYS